MTDRTDSATSRSLRRHILVGVAACAALVIGLGGWSAIASISGAVIAPGRVVVETDSKLVQHSEGGIVGAIHVKDGDRVAAGDILLVLDDTLTKANLSILQVRMDDLQTRVARLVAERDGAPAIDWPDDLSRRARSEDQLAALFRGQDLVFKTRRTTREGKRAQLKEQIVQAEEEISGLVAQRDAKSDELALIDQELAGLEELRSKSLVSVNRVIALKRQKTSVRGDHGRLVGIIARTRATISETRLKLLQLDLDFQTEVAGELNTLRAETDELLERKAAAEDRLRRIELRAPADGIVHQMNVHTVGGVVSAGETLMRIVPDLDALVIEAPVSPRDIDRVYRGQPAHIRFTAFNRRTTPEIDGAIETVAADAMTDPKSGAHYFLVRVALKDGERERLGSLSIVPGMPAEVFIQTESRRVLSYLLKPMADQVERAFREE
ncbi:MAG: HlyD family type I secretion periplasmic adaptor subunit [Rhodobiaceae bacterium]|nr:HlyD family type I secretion periplasmic adaptor subunit [Rhodobiaceae bacterium]